MPRAMHHASLGPYSFFQPSLLVQRSESFEQEMSMSSPLATLPAVPAFEKVRTIGEAIHGKVMLVRTNHAQLPEHFALKRMRKAVVYQSTGIECPRNEICATWAISQLAIPGFAKFCGVFQDEQYFYLATEYCAHGELFQLLQRGVKKGLGMGEAALKEVAIQLLKTIAELHHAGIVHLDLSLENVLVAQDGTVRIIDCSQAQRVRHRPMPTGPEQLLCFESKTGLPGKKNYRAPEVLPGSPCLGTKMDVFALGVVLYMLVVGSFPFDASNPQETFPATEAFSERLRLGAQLIHNRGSSPVSELCVDLLERMLAPNPHLRPSAIEALAHPWFAPAPDLSPDAMQ